MNHNMDRQPQCRFILSTVFLILQVLISQGECHFNEMFLIHIMFNASCMLTMLIWLAMVKHGKDEHQSRNAWDTYAQVIAAFCYSTFPCLHALPVIQVLSVALMMIGTC